MAGQSIVVWDRFTRSAFPLATILVGSGATVVTPSFAPPARTDVPDGTFNPEEPVRADFRLNARAGGQYGIE